MHEFRHRRLAARELLTRKFAGDYFQVLLRRRMPLQCRQRPPLANLAKVRITGRTVVEQRAEIELGLRVALARCHTETLQGGALVLCSARTIEIHQPQIHLGVGIALLRCAPVPRHRSSLILRDAIASVVHQAEMQLRIRVALIGSQPVPVGGGHGIATLALRVVILERQFVLRQGLAGRGCCQEFFHTGAIVWARASLWRKVQGMTNLREEVERLLPNWRSWYPSLFDAAVDLGVIRARICDPNSLLLSNRHASVRAEAAQAHRERWEATENPPEE